jgi:hypothetical protein
VEAVAYDEPALVKIAHIRVRQGRGASWRSRSGGSLADAEHEVSDEPLHPSVANREAGAREVAPAHAVVCSADDGKELRNQVDRREHHIIATRTATFALRGTRGSQRRRRISVTQAGRKPA